MNYDFYHNIESMEYFEPYKIDEILPLIVNNSMIVRNNKKCEYYNIPCSFDIETSSFYSLGGNKCACMYVWMVGINGVSFVGRTWDEFYTFIDNLVDYLELTKDKRLVCYIQNLGYEFGFIAKRFEWFKVFAIEPRKPLYAITNTGIEFRCSYRLSGYSLAKIGEHLQHPIKKLIGNLDYKKIRHSKTKLTKKELAYCLNDIRIVEMYIQEEIERNQYIFDIPLTKTGYVRRYCRESTIGTGKRKNRTSDEWKYIRLIRSLTMDYDEYIESHRCFQGGFTHTNPRYVGITLTNVGSEDFTSAYPYCMLDYYPMSKGRRIDNITKEQFYLYLDIYCCMFDIEFTNIRPKLFHENYISLSKCFKRENVIVNNGRVVYADCIALTITELDFKIIEQYYEWDSMRVRNFIRYQKGYLPTALIKAMLTLYKNKTTLKGVEGMEVEYLNSKEQLNSIYGCSVTNPIRDVVTFVNDWMIEHPDSEQAIAKYNSDEKRFLFYPWGVWITAHCRYNLFQAITELGDDYCYSDTDSVKFLNYEKHKKFFDDYNEKVRKKLQKAMEYHSLPIDSVEPSTKEGEKKLIGVFDYEGIYTKARFLGAKRYMIKKNNKLSLTVSGLNKKDVVPYLMKIHKRRTNEVFDSFNDGLYIPPGKTGKNTRTYVDKEIQGIVTDYKGIEGEYHEYSYIHLEESDYELSLSEDFKRFVNEIRKGNVNEKEGKILQT